MGWFDEARRLERERRVRDEVRRAVLAAGLTNDPGIMALATDPDPDAWLILVDRLEEIGVDVERVGLRGGGEGVRPTAEIVAACRGLDPGGEWPRVHVIARDPFAGTEHVIVDVRLVRLDRGFGNGFDLAATLEVRGPEDAAWLASLSGAEVSVRDEAAMFAGHEAINGERDGARAGRFHRGRGRDGERFAFRATRGLHEPPSDARGSHFVRMLGYARD